MSIVSLAMDGDIALLIADNPPVNTINAAVRQAMSECLTQLEQRKGVRAAVLLCDGSTFFSGADVGEFSGPPKEEEYRALFNRIEALPFPVVAAMHGTVMGGGLEIALACHTRVAAPGTRFAFPEVTLGIIPGAGGTQRMPRLVGIEATLGMVIDASPVDAAKSQRARLHRSHRRGRSEDRPRSRTPRARRRCGAPASCRSSRSTPRRSSACASRRARSIPNRNAALVAIEAVDALRRPSRSQDGLRYETELVNGAKATAESKSLVHVFFAERETRKVPGIGSDVKPRPIKSAAIVGAGTMGGGIAICFANAGIPVTVIDAAADSLERGLKRRRRHL